MVALFASFFHFCLRVEDHVVKGPDVFARNTAKCELASVGPPSSMMSVHDVSRRKLGTSTGPETAIAGRSQ